MLKALFIRHLNSLQILTRVFFGRYGSFLGLSLLTNTPFHVPVAIALLGERLRAEGTGEGLQRVVRAHVILHV